MSGLETHLVRVGIVAEDVGRVRREEIRRPPEEEGGLRGVGGCICHRLPKDVYRRAIPLVADTGFSKVAIGQIATIRADPVEKRSLAEVHAFQKIPDTSFYFGLRCPRLASALPRLALLLKENYAKVKQQSCRCISSRLDRRVRVLGCGVLPCAHKGLEWPRLRAQCVLLQSCAERAQ